jgi:hypothetical protein
MKLSLIQCVSAVALALAMSADLAIGAVPGHDNGGDIRIGVCAPGAPGSGVKTPAQGRAATGKYPPIANPSHLGGGDKVHNTPAGERQPTPAATADPRQVARAVWPFLMATPSRSHPTSQLLA